MRLPPACLLPCLLLVACGGGGSGAPENGDGSGDTEALLAAAPFSITETRPDVFESLLVCLGENSLDSEEALTVAEVRDGDVGPTPVVREAEAGATFTNLVRALTDGVVTDLLLCVVPGDLPPACGPIDDDQGFVFEVPRSASDLADFEITGFSFLATQPVRILLGSRTSYEITGEIQVFGRSR